MKRLILCLGSGGIRGFTHIGVLKALEENKIAIGAYFGSSVGSLVSVFSASGFTAYEIEKIALEIKIFDLLDLTFPKNGFIKGIKLKHFIQQHVIQKNLDELKKPVRVIATNAKRGEEIIFSTGEISDRVRASCAIPSIFRPVKIDNIEYLDGDLKSPVPMQSARREFPEDIIMGVNIIAQIDQAPRHHRKWSKWIAKDIYRRSLVDHERKVADMYLDLDIGYFGQYVGGWPKHQINVGYVETLKIIPHLLQLLEPD